MAQVRNESSLVF